MQREVLYWEVDGADLGTVTDKTASLLVSEYSARWISDHEIKELFSEKELERYILKRDKKKCRHCQEECNEIRLIVPKKEGGMPTPINMIICCEKCEELNEFDMELLKKENKEKMEQKRAYLKTCSICQRRKHYDEYDWRFGEEKRKKECRKCREKREEEEAFLHITTDIHRSSLGSEEELVAKRCLTCEKVRPVSRFKVSQQTEKPISFCEFCIMDGTYLGLIFILNGKDEMVDVVSMKRASLLRNANLAYNVNTMTLKMDSYQANIVHEGEEIVLIESLQKKSKEAKSTEISKELADSIVNKGEAFYINSRMIKMKKSVEERKLKILERDGNKCKFCSVTTNHVYYHGETFNISESGFCVCTKCEYEHVPDGILKWLNVFEKEPEDGNTMYLFDVSGTRSFLIAKEKAVLLVEEEMAEYQEGAVRLKYDITTFRTHIFSRDRNKCVYCGEMATTIDHVLPRKKKGITSPKNCVCSCVGCNEKKGHKKKEKFITVEKR